MKQMLTPQPGRIAVIRDEAEEFWNKELGWVKIDDTKDFERKINPWALVVGVGDPRVTDYGTTVTTDVKAGERVLIGEVGRTVTLKTADGQAGNVYVLPFEGVLARLEWECEKCEWHGRIEPEDGKCPECPTIVAPTLVDTMKVARKRRR